MWGQELYGKSLYLPPNFANLKQLYNIEEKKKKMWFLLTMQFKNTTVPFFYLPLKRCSSRILFLAITSLYRPSYAISPPHDT